MKKTYIVENLCCPTCAAKIEEEIARLDGVNSAKINFMTQKLTLDVDEAVFDGKVAVMKKICKRIEPDCKLTEYA